MSDKHYSTTYFEKRDHLDQHIANSLLILCRNKSVKNILEVGCGTGKLVKFLSDHKFNVLGCDNSKVAVQFALKNKIRSKIFHANATALPFKKSQFDLVISISTIEHLTKKEAVKFINESKRVLKNNGLIFLITPNFNSPFRYIFGKKWFGYSDPTHKHFYDPDSLNKLLNNNGFTEANFYFKSAYNLKFDWHIPAFLRWTPQPVKNILNYLMISSPFALYRDSFWISAKKIS